MFVFMSVWVHEAGVRLPCRKNKTNLNTSYEHSRDDYYIFLLCIIINYDNTSKTSLPPLRLLFAGRITLRLTRGLAGKGQEELPEENSLRARESMTYMTRWLRYYFGMTSTVDIFIYLSYDDDFNFDTKDWSTTR